MTELCSTDPNREGFSVERVDRVAIFRFSGRPLYFSADLVIRDELVGALERCATDPTVQVIILSGFPERADGPDYVEFFREALAKPDGVLLNRMLNVFNQFILAVLRCPKFVMFVDEGPVISQFINVSLACDYRIVGDSTVIHKAYLRHGLIPKGGAALFLSQLLGRSRAFTVLLAEANITAREALELGLVDEVVPADALAEAALARARRIAAKPPATIKGLKRLLNYPLRDLESYLEFENTEILRALRSARFP